jgi:quercetin dioxygenase-like cupin family protein
MWRGEGPADRRRALFGGVGEVRVWSLMPGTVPPFECVLGCELDPGGSVGAHRQEACAEVVVVTEGEGLARVGAAEVRLRPGTAVPVPLGAVLSLQNGSSEAPLRYLIVKARA